MTRLRLLLLIILTVSGLVGTAECRADFGTDFSLGLNLDATSQLPPRDSMKVSEKMKLEVIDLLKERRLIPGDSLVRYPRFVEFCLKVYRWAERNFNTYDTTYVVGTGKHGKVRLLSDNWTDGYMFRFRDGNPLIMVSNLYANVGIQANYSILSGSYSIDMNSLFSDRVSKHKKAGFSFTCARLFGEVYYWKNTGGTVIRKFGDTKSLRLGHFDFDGLTFKAFGATALYFFNYKKFSYAAAYNLSNYQRKSAGSWMAGIIGTFYKCDFDFAKLPEEVKEAEALPLSQYDLDYNAVGAIGGYSYNWVINKHLLFNITNLPALGLTFSFSDSTEGRKTLLAMGYRQMLSLTYTNRQFFITGNSSFHGNYFLTKSVGYMSGIENFQISTGVRF